MHYYSRARLVLRLLPLLTVKQGHVVTVHAAGSETSLNLSDLSISQDSNHSVDAARSHCTFFTSLLMQRLARQHYGKLSLVNTFPGLVMTHTSALPEQPLWFRILFKVFYPLACLIAIPQQESGERILSLASDLYPPGATEGSATAQFEETTAKRGFYACNKDGALIARNEKAYEKTGLPIHELEQLVWDHTMMVFEDIKAGGKPGCHAAKGTST